MGDYATYTDVQPRVAGRTIGASSKPTATEVTAWCTAAENMLIGALRAAGVSIPDTGSDGAAIMTEWIAGYGEGRVRLAWDATTRSGDGEAQITEFRELLTDIRENPAHYDAMLNAGVSGTESQRVRAYVLSNDDDKTISDGDFDPVFDEDWQD